MSQAVAETVDAKAKIAVLGKKMLRYRWITYGMFLLTYIFVYFDRVDRPLLTGADEGIWSVGDHPRYLIIDVLLSLCGDAVPVRSPVR